MTATSSATENGPLCVYIAARGHSGSTLLELLLNRYPGIAAIGELDQLPLQIYRDGVKTRWNGTCSCGVEPERCEVWGRVLNRVVNDSGVDIRESPFSYVISDVGVAQEHGIRRPYHYVKYRIHRLLRSALDSVGWRPTFLFPYRKWARRRDYLYRALSSVRGVNVLIDSSKDAFQMYDLIKYSTLPIKVLFLTRDVRGNAWSTIRREAGTARSEARSWVSVNRQILGNLGHVPDTAWMQVKYEDLCERTDETLQSIMQFLELDDAPLAPAEERARRHTIAGNRVRLRDLNEVSHDAVWKEKLSAKDIDDIREVAGAMAARLGYSI